MQSKPTWETGCADGMNLPGIAWHSLSLPHIVHIGQLACQLGLAMHVLVQAASNATISISLQPVRAMPAQQAITGRAVPHTTRKSLEPMTTHLSSKAEPLRDISRPLLIS